MKRIAKLVIAIFILILFFEFIAYIFKDSHKIEYKIENKSNKFIINEIYKNKKYYILITNKKNKYSFEINKDNINIEKEVYEELIKIPVTIIKTVESDYSLLSGEENITFEIYQKDNNLLYDTITTNSSGVAKIHLPYGKYIFHQINTNYGYIKSDDFEVLVNELENDIYKVVYDKKVKGKWLPVFNG